MILILKTTIKNNNIKFKIHYKIFNFLLSKINLTNFFNNNNNYYKMIIRK